MGCNYASGSFHAELLKPSCLRTQGMQLLASANQNQLLTSAIAEKQGSLRRRSLWPMIILGTLGQNASARTSTVSTQQITQARDANVLAHSQD